jgi:hypothetical protein
MKVGYIYVETDRDKGKQLLFSTCTPINCASESPAELDITCVLRTKIACIKWDTTFKCSCTRWRFNWWGALTVVLWDRNAIVFNIKQFKTLLDFAQKDATIFRNVGQCSLNTRNNISEDLNLCVTENRICLALEHAADDSCSRTQVWELTTITNVVCVLLGISPASEV